MAIWALLLVPEAVVWLLLINLREDIRTEPINNSLKLLIETIKQSDFAQRSKNADTHRNNPYFNMMAEMTARAFESYVKNELSKNGINNDFLVNITDEQDWQKNTEAYPYPKADELEQFEKAYTAVFDRLKEVDKNFTPIQYEPKPIIQDDVLAVGGGHGVRENNQDIAKILEKNATETLKNYKKDIDRFNSSINKVIGGNYGRGYVPMGRTPDVLKILGVLDTKVRIKEQHLEKVMATYLGVPDGKYETPHNVTPETLRKIPSEVHNPVAVFKSSTRDNSYLILTEQYEQKSDTGKNSPIAVICNVNAGKNDIDIVNTGSIYGRSKNQLIRNFTDNLLYVNTEKGQKLLNTERLQLSWDFTSDNSNPNRNYKTQKELSQYILEKNNLDQSQQELANAEQSNNQTQQRKIYQALASDPRTARRADSLQQAGGAVFQSILFQKQTTSQNPNRPLNISTHPTPINCPYAEKDEAKALGAKWDSKGKTWYVPAGVNLDKFDKWHNPNHQTDKATNTQHSPSKAQSNFISQQNRLYLYTKPSDNPAMQQLKAQGIVKFDLPNKLWYTHIDNADKVSQWTTRPNVPSAEQAFAEHLRANGISLDNGHPIADGRPHRLSNDGSTDKNVMYQLYRNDGGIPAGHITNFSRGGTAEKWIYPKEHIAVLKNIEAVDIARGLIKPTPKIATPTAPHTAQADTGYKPPQQHTITPEKQAIYDKTAQRVQMVMSFAPLAQKHEYLDKKQVSHHNIMRIVPDKSQLPPQFANDVVIANDWREAQGLRTQGDNRMILQKGNLIIPQYNAKGELRSFETIGYQGAKYALKDAQKSGLSTTLGNIKDGNPIIITEGYATGATLHENTGQAVVIAFGKNGLMDIAQELREHYPDSKIYIGADNDHNKEQNYGLINAKAVQEKMDNVYVLMPQFNPCDTGKDWNDVYVDKGIDEFKRQLKEQLNLINPPKEQQATIQNTKANASITSLSIKEQLTYDVIRQNHPAMSDDNIQAITSWVSHLEKRYQDSPTKYEFALERLHAKLADYEKGEILPPPKDCDVKQQDMGKTKTIDTEQQPDINSQDKNGQGR